MSIRYYLISPHPYVAVRGWGGITFEDNPEAAEVILEGLWTLYEFREVPDFEEMRDEFLTFFRPGKLFDFIQHEVDWIDTQRKCKIRKERKAIRAKEGKIAELRENE